MTDPLSSRPKTAAPLVVMCAALALLACGCAYYNTFYTAKKAYEKAMIERANNPLEGASAAELTQYETCIRAATNLLVKYPNSKYVDDAVLLIGKSYLGRGEYDKAADEFQLLCDSIPTSEFVPDALTGKAQALAHERRYVESESTFTRVLARYPAFEHKDEVLLGMGDLDRQQRRTQDALLYYDRLIVECPRSDYRYLARNQRGESYMGEEQWDSARVEFEAVVRDAPKEEDRFAAQLKVGDAYEGAAQFDQAISHYRLTQENARKLQREPEVLIRIAVCQAKGGDPDKALDLLDRLQQDNKTNKYSSSAAYQIGYIQEIYKEDFDKARAAYDAARTLPRSEFTDLAAERNKGLVQAAEYKKKLEESKSHFDAKAETAYLLGELYYFQIKKNDRALAQYLSVERTYSYTRFGPQAAYAAGWLLDRMKNPAAAESAYARAAARYPKTAFGQASRDSLRARWGAAADSMVALAQRDTTNIPLPKPPEAVADSIVQAAFADSVRKVFVADSLQKARQAAIRDSLDVVAKVKAHDDSLKAAVRVAAAHAAADSAARSPADSLKRASTPPEQGLGPGRFPAIEVKPDSTRGRPPNLNPNPNPSPSPGGGAPADTSHKSGGEPPDKGAPAPPGQSPPAPSGQSPPAPPPPAGAAPRDTTLAPADTSVTAPRDTTRAPADTSGAQGGSGGKKP